MNELRITLTGKLVNAQALLNDLFTEESRPSLRWLRQCGLWVPPPLVFLVWGREVFSGLTSLSLWSVPSAE